MGRRGWRNVRQAMPKAFMRVRRVNFPLRRLVSMMQRFAIYPIVNTKSVVLCRETHHDDQADADTEEDHRASLSPLITI